MKSNAYLGQCSPNIKENVSHVDIKKIEAKVLNDTTLTLNIELVLFNILKNSNNILQVQNNIVVDNITGVVCHGGDLIFVPKIW